MSVIVNNIEEVLLLKYVYENFYNCYDESQPLSKFSEFLIRLPIKEMCGITVIVNLSFSRNSIDLKIEGDKIISKTTNLFETLFYYTLSKFTEFPSNEEFVTALENLTETLNNIRFNKFQGRFILEETYDNPKLWEGILGNNKHIKFTFGACCVCNESTKSITHNCCNNFFCYECWNQLKPFKCKNCEEETSDNCLCCGQLKCPLCRASLFTGNSEEDSERDDDREIDI